MNVAFEKIVFLIRRFSPFLSKTFIKYLMIGIVGLAVDLGIYSILVFYSVFYQTANFISYTVTTLYSFLLNRSLNFKVKNKPLKRAVLFMSAAFVGYLSSVLILYILVDLYSINEILSKLTSLMVAVSIQYSLNKHISFRQ